MKRTDEEKPVTLVAEVCPETGKLKILKGGPGCPKGFMKRAVAAARKGISFPEDACDSDALGINEYDLRLLMLRHSHLFHESSRVSLELRGLSKEFPTLVEQGEVTAIITGLEAIVTRLNQTVEAEIEKIKSVAVGSPTTPAIQSS